MTIPCPFQVGDRIHELIATPGHYDDADPAGSYQILRLDSSRPDATVTEITPEGFTYEYDTPFVMGRAEWGQMCTGGICFPEGYEYWSKI